MQVFTINAGSFMCDGGGIFGAVPKVLWSKQITADENNRIRIPLRCLLLITENRKMLIETGAGDKHKLKYNENNGLKNHGMLIQSLKNAGVEPTDITDVLLTHLHWDHCGGNTYFSENNTLELCFTNATYHCSKAQWENALNPNPRDGDAYFRDDFIPILEKKKLHLIETEAELFKGLDLRIFNGHTPGMLVPIIATKNRKIAYVNDMIPTIANIPPKWISAYDSYPVTAMEEKNQFLREAAENNYLLYFEHDVNDECATVSWDEIKGPKLEKSGSLSDFLE